MIGLLKPKRERLAYKIERNMIALEAAANKGKWEAVSMFASNQTRLLVQYQVCEGASEAHLDGFLKGRGLVRSVQDTEYSDWIDEELLKRNLMPM